MYKKFEEKFIELKKRLNGKKIILWGYGLRGRLFEVLLQLYVRKADAIIDMDRSLMEQKIRSVHILGYFDSATTTILFTPREPLSSVKLLLDSYGFRDSNVIHLMDFFYGSDKEVGCIDYYEWLEFCYNVDFCKGKIFQESLIANLNYEKVEFHNYGAFSGVMLESVLRKFQFDDNDAVFDFGCGKGGALTIFRKAGVGSIGGIEFDEELYRIACRNMDILGCEHKLVCGNAADYTDIDSYNIFFLFDPFEGLIFEKVITHMEESFARKNRKIILIYAAPQCHQKVIAHGVFKLSAQYETFYCITKTTNVYLIED